MTMKDKPWFAFYAQDWLSDPHLRACSPASRGILTDMMALAHNGEPYGYLTNGGLALDEQTLSRALAVNGQTLSKAVAQLEQTRRIVRAPDGQWYIPAMVRKQAQHTKAVENGGKGGNPQITKRVNPPLNPSCARSEQSRAEQKEEPPSQKSTPKGAARPVPRAPTFKKPTLEDVSAYIAEIEADVDPQAWLDHYTANGWRVGKNPMRDWKAAVRTWKRNEYGTGPGRKSRTMGKDGIDLGY